MRAGSLAWIVIAGAACATANPSTDAGSQPADGRVDAPADAPRPDGGIIDAPAIDAPAANTFTLSQTTLTTSLPNGSVTCINNIDQTSGENSWYRVFRLADAGLTGGVRVTSVTFGVQQATAGTTVQVRVGTYSGTVAPTAPTTLDLTRATWIQSELASMPAIAANATQLFNVPITANIPALSQVIVEVFVANQAGLGRSFLLGGNNGGQTAPTWLRAPGCGTTVPTTVAQLGFPSFHLVLQASGTY